MKMTNNTAATMKWPCAPKFRGPTRRISIFRWTETDSSISGEKKETSEKKEQSFLHRETYYGRFSRQIELQQGVDPEKVDAEYKGGVLTVHMKKMPGAAAKKVPVKTT
jgi:HSP20 family molecular chaperone IbpA